MPAKEVPKRTLNSADAKTAWERILHDGRPRLRSMGYGAEKTMSMELAGILSSKVRDWSFLSANEGDARLRRPFYFSYNIEISLCVIPTSR